MCTRATRGRGADTNRLGKVKTLLREERDREVEFWGVRDGIRPYMHAKSAHRLDTSIYMRSRLWIHVRIRPPGVEGTRMYELV